MARGLHSCGPPRPQSAGSRLWPPGSVARRHENTPGPRVETESSTLAGGFFNIELTGKLTHGTSLMIHIIEDKQWTIGFFFIHTSFLGASFDVDLSIAIFIFYFNLILKF